MNNKNSEKKNIPAAPKLTALVVDDAPMNIVLYKKLLESAGFDIVIGERDAAGALDQVRKRSRPFDLLVLDVRLEEYDGISLCSVIKKKRGYENVPVVMVTFLNNSENKRRAYAVGAEAYLIKPINPEHCRALYQIALHKAQERILEDELDMENKFGINSLKIISEALENYSSELETLLLRHQNKMKDFSVILVRSLPGHAPVREEQVRKAIRNSLLRAVETDNVSLFSKLAGEYLIFLEQRDGEQCAHWVSQIKNRLRYLSHHKNPSEETRCNYQIFSATINATSVWEVKEVIQQFTQPRLSA